MTAMTRPRHSWWIGPLAGFCLLGLGVLFAEAMPDPMATHWGLSGRPDGAMPLWQGICIAPVLATVGALVSTGREDLERKRLLVWALSFGVSLQVSVLWSNAGASDWTQARSLDLWMLPLVVGVPLALGWYVGRDTHPIPPALVVPAALRTHLAPGQRAAWSSSASSRWGLLLDAGVLVAGLALGRWELVLAALVCLPFTAVRVTAGNQGVVLRLAVPWVFRKRYPLETIAQARVADYQSFSFGYRGSRQAFGEASWAVRRGEALVLQLKDGTTLTITVDDAAKGAALLNALLPDSE
jgi:hypothetical protein